MTAPVGELLKDWRTRRRLSQLDLSNQATVSARHLSFVETGRSKPSRELVLHLAEHLDVPLRERNALLHAAGYAPVYRETPMDDADMAPVRAAIETVLRSHEPFPALVVDRLHHVLYANDTAERLFVSRVAPHLLTQPVNALRATLHPDGLAKDIVNLAELSAHLLAGLDREVAASADPLLAELAAELRTYPGVAEGGPSTVASQLFVPMVLRSDEGELRFFSTITTFGTPLDITTAELALEAFFPADDATANALSPRRRSGAGRR
jgi:transcriptional regulator with XRE-family HTH domain